MVLSASAGAGGKPNPIVLENRLPGTSRFTYPDAPARTIEGYAASDSVRAGDVLAFQVSTRPAAQYRIEIYRLGWYRGAGARLQDCLPLCGEDRKGAPQPQPPPPGPNGLVQPDWEPTDSIFVPRAWVTGLYVAEFLLTSGPAAGHASRFPFVVRAPRGSRATILVQVPVNTWQAYNPWGGASLYGRDGGGPAAVRVSFDRPYAASLRSPFVWEYQLVRFLERQGYDIAYTADTDTDRDPAELLRHRLVLTVGHDEYWTKTMRDAFERARDGGVNLAFLGANTGYWQMRYEDGRRTMVEYRSSSGDPEPDPALKTVRFRDLVPARPECRLLGVQLERYVAPTSVGRDYTVHDPAIADPWLAGTGFQPGAVLPALVGYEWDSLVPGCVASPVTIFFSYAGPPSAEAVRYTAPSGARVFSAGSLQFAWGLDATGTPAGVHADLRLQRFMRNALADLTR